MKKKAIITCLFCFLGLSGLIQLNAQGKAAPTIPGKHHLPSTDGQYRTPVPVIEPPYKALLARLARIISCVILVVCVK